MENKLEKLLRENKSRMAKKQLIDDLMKLHEIDISEKEFIDFSISKEVHKKVYERIKTDNNIKTITFPYDEEKLMSNINFIFDYLKKHEDKKVLFYPSAFGFYFKSSNQLYLEYPIAITSPLSECKQIIIKLMLEMHDDLIILSEELNFGFVLSEDEYSCVSIEYWEE
ncbi:hypothetical protein EJF36_06675 [Bacillus sp. HMF5848]|uniref:hypothetical protein n=1 Tax=Bacillus sp. HMF5848 TaxID=2495421 RepID=UPI000F7B6BFC|nr:hypothetical protein [Bacillus sp. HMF5848]RSK26568.1 hypothetical protein EJF36_06675 [Bacillus sp. HMF5848]